MSEFNCLRTMPEDKLQQYWETKLESLRAQVEYEEESDPLSNSFLELMERAMECRQYEMSHSDTTPVTRMVKVRMKMPRKAIEQLFDIKTTNVFYTGLYIPMEGVLVSEGTRKRSHYDDCTKKGVRYDLASLMPEGFKDEYEEGLATPAMGGLFVPKKSSLTQSGYLSRPYQIQFFDIMI